MQKIFSKVINTEVINAQNGKRLARLHDLIIDPDNGKIIAIIINPKKNLIVSILDISKWGNNIQVNDPHAIIDGFEILKVKKIQEEEKKIIGSSVKTEDNDYIGKVHDYYIETDLGNLSKIITKKHFLFFNYDERIIDFKDILEIKKGEIIIKSDYKTVKETEKTESTIKAKEKLIIERARLKNTNKNPA